MVVVHIVGNNRERDRVEIEERGRGGEEEEEECIMSIANETKSETKSR